MRKGWMVVFATGAVMLTSAATIQPEPGKWSHKGTVESIDIPGIPDFLAKSAAKPKPHNSCLTPGQASKTPAELLRQRDVKCTDIAMTMAGGKISGTASCLSPRLTEPLKVTTTGTYSARSYAMRSVSTGKRDGKPMKVVINTTGKWLGPCK